MITPESAPASDGLGRPVTAIDACFMGWVPGVTSSHESLGVDSTGPGTGAKIDDPAFVLQMGAEVAAKRPVYRMDGSHGRGVIIYESTGGTPYRLDEIIRAEIAWKLKDPFALKMLRWRDMPEEFEKFAFRKALAAEEDAIARATAFIEGLEILFRDTTFGGLCQHGPNEPAWILLEGGLHLLSRCVAEVGRSFGFPIAAIENCWLPGHFIFTPETGAAVNRFAQLYDRARGRVPDIAAIVETMHLVGKARKPKKDIAWYHEAYPWKFGGVVTETVEDSAIRIDEMRESLQRHRFVILGQVPYDSSITMDSNVMTVDRIVGRMIQELGEAGVRRNGIMYRPHPMEEPSTLTGMTSSEAFQGICARNKIPHVIYDGAKIPLDAHIMALEPGKHVVITANSQAAFEASNFVDVITYGRAFYDVAGVTRKSWCETPVPSVTRASRWAAFVRWMMEKLYVPKKGFGIDTIQERTSDWQRHGFSFFDPSEEY